ncbi:MAG: hypothetical protein L3J89_00740 [Gammaproteobacteria bacterium]|nr:hypothetical protein [Gammaproteobacteria bacterium]
MKIRNIVRGLALVGATAALLPIGSAMAGGPGFDGIQVNAGSTGTLSGCAAGAVCVPLVTGEGFLQQEVTIGGNTFIQTIIVDPLSSNASTALDVSGLAFSDMTFIQMSGANNGIKAMQRLRDDPTILNPADTSGNLFESTTQLLIGTWAQGTDHGDDANLKITQSFRDNSNTGIAIGATGATETADDFVNEFTLDVNLDSSGEQTGKRMDMLQDVGMSDPGATVVGDDFQRFVIRQRSGDLLTSTGSLELGTPSAGTGTGGSVDWSAGEDVLVTWLGQRVNLGGTGSAVFGFQSVDNLSDTDAPISTFSTSTAAFGAGTPFVWDSTTFGVEPAL